ncbi:MAG: hypothetical protein MUC59_07425 [Saprospiraceae bacterium]|jgi:hypothetical protein|nr:hypothetical protein [Saprospiraceae bacterium]
MENQEKSKLKAWLDKIEQDSWQLELVVTAFSIFLVLGGLDAIEEKEPVVRLLNEGTGSFGVVVSTSFIVLAISLLFILINLLLHVVLRGLWIGAIGLRSVSGDIDFEGLGLAPRFDQFLRRKTGSFDGYIERLENLCSIVFAFTFVLVFVIFSVVIWGFVVAFIMDTSRSYLSGLFGEIVFSVLEIAIVLSTFVYLLDFVTLGWVKKRRRFSKVYYPIYRIYGFITLSALYRPMYYNLIDNKLGRKAALLLIPYIVVVVWLASMRVDSHAWYATEDNNHEIVKSCYDDLREEGKLVKTASIPSKFVANGYLELFIRYLPFHDDKILKVKCPGVVPPVEPGIRSGFYFDFTGKEEEEAMIDFPKLSLECLSSLYELRINDSLYQKPGYRFFRHPNKDERGLLALLDVAYLPRGEHEIILRKLGRDTTEGSEALIMKDFVRFPFWKE